MSVTVGKLWAFCGQPLASSVPSCCGLIQESALGGGRATRGAALGCHSTISFIAAIYPRYPRRPPSGRACLTPQREPGLSALFVDAARVHGGSGRFQQRSSRRLGDSYEEGTLRVHDPELVARPGKAVQ
jgi:hypothetical protein